jgi:hypothetical protein
MSRSPLWWRKLKAWLAPRRQLVVVEGDTLPAQLPQRDLVLAKDDGEDWSIGMACPCGCGERLELMLLANVKPRWSVAVDDNQHPSLHPSVWLQSGCRSHFWLRGGKVYWCD